MIDFSQDYFALFGLPPRYAFDAAKLDAAYRALQSAGASRPLRGRRRARTAPRAAIVGARQRGVSRAASDPVERAQYLLSLHGVDALAETDTALPPDFLEQQLEWREAVADAIARATTRALEALLDGRARDERR